MAPLRAALEASGLEACRTVLQSGNVVFRTGKSKSVAATLVGDTIEDAFGLRVVVVLRSAAELAAVAVEQPVPRRRPRARPDDAPCRLSLEATQRVPRSRSSIPTARRPTRSPSKGREVYLSYPSGSGRSRLTLDYLERVLGVRGTARNWRTVQRLATALLEAQNS